MIDRRALLDGLQGLLRVLEADLLERSESTDLPDVGDRLRAAHRAVVEAERTARSYEEWRAERITQAAAAWVLSAVFVRFLEDNDLIPVPKIAGPGERLARARLEHERYFRDRPTHNDRDYLLHVFDALTSHAPTRAVFGDDNPIREHPRWLSGDAAAAILGFFQRVESADGRLVHDFSDPELDTRFLGDLYQDLSEAARKQFALLQTPEFVEEFILDRAMTPALDEFGLARFGYEARLEIDGRLAPGDRFRMIDPACGSGHFLLGAFHRLLDAWRRKEPGTVSIVLVQRALDGVHGVDLNPYAIAIARFRLLVAALRESDVRRIADAPAFAIHLLAGDSLLHGVSARQGTMGWTDLDQVYDPEDRPGLERMLRPGSYHVVVANPPYITPKDRALNQAYRDRFNTCHRQYSLAVPFLERIVLLAVEGGYTGQITANSFMKREFGKKLIEEYFPRVDLTHVIDTSGAYIPGHGTPTVILFIRNRLPVRSRLRTVLGIRGEPSTPDDPARGRVWSAILAQVDDPGSQSEFVSVNDSPRELFIKHPWSIGGGGAAELKERLEEGAEKTLGDLVESIGFYQDTHADEAFVQPSRFASRKGIRNGFREQIRGDGIRDWASITGESIVFPYDTQLNQWPDIPTHAGWTWLHDLKPELWSRSTFGGGTYRSQGRPWFDYHQFPKDRARTPLSIAFAEVATHNHFVLDRGGKVFNRTAPVIKLPADATEDDHLALLGLLNSSTACFWMRQVCFSKGGDHVGQEGARVTRTLWEERFAFNATNLMGMPLSEFGSLRLPASLDKIASRFRAACPESLLLHTAKIGSSLDAQIGTELYGAAEEWADLRRRMIALQEELDWECYRLYGLIDEDLTYPGEPPEIAFGERAFEIAMHAEIAAGRLNTTWFARHNAEPVAQPRDDWPADYSDLVRRRIAVIAEHPEIALIERPEYKRRWNTEPWDEQLARALRDWLLDRLESYCDFDGRMNERGEPTARVKPGLVSLGTLTDLARNDPRFHEVAALYRGDQAYNLTALVAELLESESVAFLPILRYKPSGLRKRLEWERTWELQRLEDAIDARTRLARDHPEYLSEIAAADLKRSTLGAIPVPPKFATTDFAGANAWRLRGKLDVPKERWVSFPHCEAADDTLMVAWAGLDHLQLAQALSTHYVDVLERLGGRGDPRLVPLLAAILELLPWIEQWHAEVDPSYGRPLGEYFRGFVEEEARNLEIDLETIRAWTPPAKLGKGKGKGKGKGRGKGKTAKPARADEPSTDPESTP